MDSLNTHRRSLTVKEIISGIVIVFVAIILLYLLWRILNAYIDPGSKNSTQKKDLVQAFTVIVGGFVAFGTLLIGWRNLRHNQRTLLVNQQNAQQTLDHSVAIEDRRAQDDTLQSYLEQIGKLILDNDLRTSHDDSEVRILAQAQTHTVLPTLNEERKRSVLIFLYKSNLLAGRKPSVGLVGADLSGADLRKTQLPSIVLRGADLSGADLRGAFLVRADLRGVNFQDVDLKEGILQSADLREADLRRADLRRADLKGAHLQGADLREADFRGAELIGDLRGVNFKDVDLREADLQGANLQEADLLSAKVTDEQLAGMLSLQYATMPNGSEHP